jgi:hypothetical protein
MRLRIQTKETYYIIDNVEGHYRIKDCGSVYLKTEILNKRVSRPRKGLPLVIEIGDDDLLYRSRILSVTEINHS